MERDRKELVVDQSVEHSKEAHEQKNVSHRKNAVYSTAVSLFQGLIHHAKDEAYQEKQEAMAQITEHDTKEEGECDDSEDCRIDFLVHRNTVGVHDLLEDPCEIICLDIGWGLDTMVFIALEVCGGETSQGTSIVSSCIEGLQRYPI